MIGRGTIQRISLRIWYSTIKLIKFGVPFWGRFSNFFLISSSMFEEILNMIIPRMTKTFDTRLRNAIPTHERLTCTSASEGKKWKIISLHYTMTRLTLFKIFQLLWCRLINGRLQISVKQRHSTGKSRLMSIKSLSALIIYKWFEKLNEVICRKLDMCRHSLTHCVKKI